jgi:hypothetical protein
VDPCELLPLSVSEEPAEEGLTPSTSSVPGGFVIHLPRWILFTNAVEETLSEVALQFSVKPPILGCDRSPEMSSLLPRTIGGTV